VDAVLEGHRRYLAALREACSHTPRPHSHQLAALDREISLAGAAGDLAGYLAASGELFELTRAAWLDRIANHARVGTAVGDPGRAEAAAIEYAGALEATGHADWTEHVAAAGARATAVRTRGSEAGSAYGGLLASLLRLHSTAGEAERDAWRGQATGAYRSLLDADPEFAWRPLSEQPRYRLRTPWTGSGLRLVVRWLEELDVSGEARESEDTGRADPIAAIEAGEARWRSALAERGAGGTSGGESSSGDSADPYPALEDSLAPLRAQAEEALERQSRWPDPLVVQHWRSLRHGLDHAHTPTEVELISVHAEACFEIEADWNIALLGSLLAPLRTACTWGWDGGPEARAALEVAAESTYALLGLGPRATVSLPRVADFVAAVVGAPGELSAFAGEAGFEALGEARMWIAAMHDLGREAPGDPAAMRAALLALFDGARVAEPTAEPRPVTLWGADLDLDDLHSELARGRRPPIPGLEPMAPSTPGL
jgi:hypothetical protein